MTLPRPGLFAGMLLACLLASPALASPEIVYTNLAGVTNGYIADTNANTPIFGDALTLTKPGTLTAIQITLYNADTTSTNTIITGSTLLQFYDNTTPYSGGTLTNTLLGQAQADWDFTDMGGLPGGIGTRQLFDFSALSISLPRNILILQQFTLDTGTSTANGVWFAPTPTIGSSPTTIFISAADATAGNYTFSGYSNQVGYTIELEPVPEPASALLLLTGSSALLLRRRRQHRASTH